MEGGRRGKVVGWHQKVYRIALIHRRHKMKKRILSSVLALALVIGLAFSSLGSITAFAWDDTYAVKDWSARGSSDKKSVNIYFNITKNGNQIADNDNLPEQVIVRLINESSDDYLDYKTGRNTWPEGHGTKWPKDEIVERLGGDGSYTVSVYLDNTLIGTKSGLKLTGLNVVSAEDDTAKTTSYLLDGLKRNGTTMSWKSVNDETLTTDTYTVMVHYFGEDVPEIKSGWAKGREKTGDFKTTETSIDISSAIAKSGYYTVFVYRGKYNVVKYWYFEVDADDDSSENYENEESSKIETSDGKTITSNVATYNPTATHIAVTDAFGDVKRAAGVPADQTVDMQVDNTVGPLAKEAIDITAASKGVKVANYMEISMFGAEASGARLDKISNLSTPVEFVFSAPSDVDAKTNDFAIMRITDGRAVIIPDTDSDPKTITIKNDRSSAFAIVYGPKGSFK